VRHPPDPGVPPGGGAAIPARLTAAIPRQATGAHIMTKRALCVGINDYPGANMDLAGCVNDATDWQALLERRGYRVARLHDGEATRAALVEGLAELMTGAADGDSLVFTFSGHGSWLPDD